MVEINSCLSKVKSCLTKFNPSNSVEKDNSPLSNSILIKVLRPFIKEINNSFKLP
jgi:hypothetical protein